MQVLHSSQLQEKIHTITLPNGLKIYVYRKPGYKGKFASLTVHYGSIDNSFIDPASGQNIELPPGIAHFLEHKIFAKEDGSNWFDDFSSLGASCNAFTSNTQTTYYFSTIDNFAKCLDLLMCMVNDLYLTEEAITREKKIIEQELRMYQDQPNSRVHANLLKALYHTHPVRIEIGGTVESIQEVARHNLDLCHKTFYHPANMILFVAGDIEPSEVLDQVGQKSWTNSSIYELKRILPTEPTGVASKGVSDQLAIVTPIIYMGFKELSVRSQEQMIKNQITTGVALELLFGRGAELYSELYAAGLVDDSFGYSFTDGNGYGHTTIGGQSQEPDILRERILKGIADRRQRGIEPSDVERCRKGIIGSFISAFNNLESVAHGFVGQMLRGVDLFSYYQAILDLDAQDVSERINHHFNQENMSISTIKPL